MKLRQIALAAAMTAAFSLAQGAVVVSKDATNTNSIPGLTGFSTTGAMMDGLRVTATFQTGLVETRAWADTGAASGGVSGTGWSLSQAGDTFTNAWTFSFTGTAAALQLVSLVLDGSGPGQVTIFDTDTDATPAQDTPGSARGTNFSITSGCVGCDGTAVYSNQVGIGANPPLGDIFHTLTVTFTGGTGPRSNFSFLQDTDNDIRLNQPVPEPGTLALVGLALAAVGLRARRRA
jgi:hypothetical protein